MLTKKTKFDKDFLHNLFWILLETFNKFVIWKIFNPWPNYYSFSKKKKKRNENFQNYP